MAVVSGKLAFWDYSVIVVVMLISVAIGWFFRRRSSSDQQANELLMANRNMKRFPVVFSLVVSKMSAIALIGEPADVMTHGTQRCIAALFLFVGAFVTAYVFLPVFYAVGATTIYAYLGERFGSNTRILVSSLCYFQMIFQLAVVLYAPALALDAVTDLNLSTSIVLMSVVCILFSVMGGMRGVMWTDVFQSIFMYVCLTSVIAFGIYEAGGLYSVYRIASDDGKLTFFDFSFDPTTRYTFWNALSLGVQYGIVSVAINQTEIQRVLSISKLKDGQSALLWYSVPAFIMSALINASGLVLYAVFKDNSPLSPSSGIGLEKADQILPYFIITRMSKYPGLAGLCVSGIFCASITSLSSAINSMSTIVIDDFISPRISSKQLASLNFNLLAKALMVLNGCVITLMPLVLPFSTGIYEIIVSIYAVLYGPLFGFYLLGMLSEAANEKGSLMGLFLGIVLVTWKTVGRLTTNKKMAARNLIEMTFRNSTILSDDSLFHSMLNETLTIQGNEEDIDCQSTPLVLYRLSFAWDGLMGILSSLIFGYLASYVINCFYKKQKVDPILFSPVAKYWMKAIPEKSDLLVEKEQETNC